jgi:type I restriction enzyme S subunit
MKQGATLSLPKGWEIKKLGEVVDIINGRNQSQVISENGEYPIYGSAGNLMGYATNYLCEKGTTIIGRKGNISNPIFIEERFWNVDTAFGLFPKNGYDPKFINYLCQTIDFKSRNRGTTIPSLVKSDLLTIDVPFISPLAEQQRIVSILDECFAAIDKAKVNAEQNLKNAKELFESYLQGVFENGKNWQKQKLGDVCGFVRGPFGGSLKKNIFKPDGFAVYEQQHAIYDQFDNVRYYIDEIKFNEMKRFELNSGDLIMSCSGTMGKIAIVPENIKKGIINQALLKLSPSKKVSNEFLKLWMQSESFQNSLKEYAGGAAIQNVASVAILKNIEIPLPDIAIQKNIVQKVQGFSAETQKIEAVYQKKIADMEELKKSVLHKAFSGELKTEKAVAL